MSDSITAEVIGSINKVALVGRSVADSGCLSFPPSATLFTDYVGETRFTNAKHISSRFISFHQFYRAVIESFKLWYQCLVCGRFVQ